MGYVMHFLTPTLLTDLQTFYAFFIMTQFKKIGRVPPPSMCPALRILRSHFYCCSYAMKLDGRRTNRIIVENHDLIVKKH